MPDRLKLAEEWLAHGDRDFGAAEALLAEGHFTDTIAMLLQQAAEKYLKGYLVYRGWELRKTHDLRRLTAEAIKYEPAFSEFRDFARKATAYYLEHRYPPGPPADFPKEEIAEVLDQTRKLINLIKQSVRQTGGA